MPHRRYIEEALYRLWDDHAKWEADKKRGYTSLATVMLTAMVKNAPYSDMGSAIGGIKAVTNSMLLLLPSGLGSALLLAIAGIEAGPAGQPRESSKRDTRCFKLPTAVTRLETELRSTPVQQINDWRFMVEELSVLQTYMDQTCTRLYSLSDNGWDHGVLYFEAHHANSSFVCPRHPPFPQPPKPPKPFWWASPLPFMRRCAGAIRLDS